MATYTSKIKAYVGADVDFLNDVVVFDDGNGQYIKEWNIQSKPKPTDEQLSQYESEAAAMDLAVSVIQNRRNEYPAIGDQLDALFHAGVFPEDMAAKIQAVKTKYPKESA
jgi:hypothetical protein